jgi:hypothetical protein
VNLLNHHFMAYAARYTKKILMTKANASCLIKQLLQCFILIYINETLFVSTYRW